LALRWQPVRILRLSLREQVQVLTQPGRMGHYAEFRHRRHHRHLEVIDEDRGHDSLAIHAEPVHRVLQMPLLGRRLEQWRDLRE
jgi:hypothetical protein